MNLKWITLFALLAVCLMIGISDFGTTLGLSYLYFCVIPTTLILLWFAVTASYASGTPAATADRGETIARLKGTAYVVAVVILLSTASPWACGLIVAIKVFWPEKYVADGRFLSGGRFPTRLGYTDQDEV